MAGFPPSGGRPTAFRLDFEDEDSDDSGGSSEWSFAERDIRPEATADALARWRRLVRHIFRVWALRRVWGHLGGTLRRYRGLR